MTATLPDRPLTDAELEADANSRHKGDLIGAYLYRCGLTVDDVTWLPLTDRRGPSRARLARAAYRAIPDPGCPRAGQHTPPHTLGSVSWRYAREVLVDLEEREAFGFDPTPRDLLEHRDQWLPPAEEQPLPVPCSPAVSPQARVEEQPGPAVPDGSPRGWAELAALGPLPDRTCSWCRGGPAIVGTLDGWRCAACPPTRDRAGWGWNLDWAPKPGTNCPRSSCWCGRCAHYTPATPPLPGMRAIRAPAIPPPKPDRDGV